VLNHNTVTLRAFTLDHLFFIFQIHDNCNQENHIRFCRCANLAYGSLSYDGNERKRLAWAYSIRVILQIKNLLLP